MIQYIKHIRIERDDGIFFTENNSKSSFILSDFIHDNVFDRDSSTFLTLSIELIIFYKNIKENTTNYKILLLKLVVWLMLICYYCFNFKYL